MAIITGTSGDDEIYGGETGDELYGLEGDDILTGGVGEDLISGGEGNDVLSGGEGDDIISGDDGDDLIYADYGDDQLIGGDDMDEVVLTGWAYDYVVTRGSGGSFLITDRTGQYGNKTLTGVERISFGAPDYGVDLSDLAPDGTSGDDVIEGGEGLDWLVGLGGDDLLRGGAGTNVIDGGDGTDTSVYAGASSDYRIYRLDGVVQVDRTTLDGEDPMVLGSDLLVDVEFLYFEGDEIVVDVDDIPAFGTAGDDLIIGSAFHDLLLGLGGADTLEGLAGDDELRGGEGDDSYYGGTGDEYIVDDGGDDVYRYETGDGDDRISDFTGTDALLFGPGIDPEDLVVAIDAESESCIITFAGAGGSVTLLASANSNENSRIEEVRFDNGTIWSAAQLHAFASAVNIVTGGQSDDLLTGEAGVRNALSGLGGNDQLTGWQADDTLDGGAGVDVLTGGAGVDRFCFAAGDTGTGAAADRIADFLSGTDKIDLSSLDADIVTSGDQAFTFVGNSAFSSSAGELRYAFDGTDTRIEGDVDGDGAADFAILLSDSPIPLGSDLIL